MNPGWIISIHRLNAYLCRCSLCMIIYKKIEHSGALFHLILISCDEKMELNLSSRPSLVSISNNPDPTELHCHIHRTHKSGNFQVRVWWKRRKFGALKSYNRTTQCKRSEYELRIGFAHCQLKWIFAELKQNSGSCTLPLVPKNVSQLSRCPWPSRLLFFYSIIDWFPLLRPISPVLGGMRNSIYE
jgi:hypothetical protein